MGRGSVSSGCRRSPHKARPFKSSPLSDSIVVTHPFHPLAGQRLAVIFEKRRPGAERVLVCEGGPAGRVTLPVAWTDRALPRSVTAWRSRAWPTWPSWPPHCKIHHSQKRICHDLVWQ